MKEIKLFEDLKALDVLINDLYGVMDVPDSEVKEFVLEKLDYLKPELDELFKDVTTYMGEK